MTFFASAREPISALVPFYLHAAAARLWFFGLPQDFIFDRRHM